jgi:hypothetical protein
VWYNKLKRREIMTYKIMGKYGNLPWEEVDQTEDVKDAQYLLGEYRMAYGTGWQLKIKKEK